MIHQKISKSKSVLCWVFTTSLFTGCGESMTDEDKRADVENAYQEAKALPAKDSCANEQAYTKLIELEKTYKTDLYQSISRDKVLLYGDRCALDKIMKYSPDGDSPKRKRQRNSYLAEFKNTYLLCNSAELVHGMVERSQPLYIVTGNYQDRNYGNQPENQFQDDEVIVRLAKSNTDTLIRYEIYQQSTIDGALKDYVYGESEAKLEEYSLGGWNLERDSLKLKTLETQQVDQYHSRIGDFTVNWFLNYEFACEILSDPIESFLDYIELRASQLSMSKLKRDSIEAERQKIESKKLEEAQKNRNKI